MSDNSNGTNNKNVDPATNRLSVPVQPNSGLLLTIPRTPGDAPQVLNIIFCCCISFLNLYNCEFLLSESTKMQHCSRRGR